MKTFKLTFCCLLFSLVTSISHADLVPGLLFNFQDGTVQGWDGGTVTNVANSGPLGAGDFSLQLANGGIGDRFAMFNTGVNGVISPSVSAISVDIFRPSGQGIGSIRLVLFDTGSNRWTSNLAASIPDDGAWHRYSFSTLEADLTRVEGFDTYSDLTNNLERIMFRYDPGTPSAGGAPLSGTMNFDNISAIPEPSTCMWLLMGLATLSMNRRRV